MPAPEPDLDGLEARIAALPGVAAVREAAVASGSEAYLVGGAVRDALLGGERADLDVVVAGDHLALVEALGGESRVHDRFGTATVAIPDGEIDVAAARAERYPHPGALPEVSPASIEADLSRRDFGVNALAVPLRSEFALLDPLGGLADLRTGVLRLLHERSIADDPTRALRAARYAARLGFEPEPASEAQIRAARLETVSAERVEAELRRLAAEPSARRGFELLDEWGLAELAPGGGERIDAALALANDEPWRGAIAAPEAVLAARAEPSAEALALAAAHPAMPSAGVELVRGLAPAELLAARLAGAAWIDEYLSDWRGVRLEISGADLLAAGVPEGPGIGAGLAAALRGRLDGEIIDRDEELRVALAAAGA